MRVGWVSTLTASQPSDARFSGGSHPSGATDGGGDGQTLIWAL
jgi:hypothetical protein